VAPVKIGRRISTLELIDEVGRKSAIAGGQKSGGYWAAQKLPSGPGAGLRLLIAEGVSTALSAKAATGHPAIAALSCGNLLPVARAMRDLHPLAVLVILADLGKGQRDAEQAARNSGALLALPQFGPNPPEGASDFNDLAVFRGLAAVAHAIESAVPAENPDIAEDIAWPELQSLVANFEPEQFPMDALPLSIRTAVEEVHGFVKAPIPLVVSSALATVSIAVQSYVDVQRVEGLSGPVSLFLLSIADSGERKSTCDKLFTGAIRKYEHEQVELAKPDLARHRAEHKAWEAKRTGLADAIKRASRKGATDELKQSSLNWSSKSPPRPASLV
jgi:putative DNA primase/helicase